MKGPIFLALGAVKIFIARADSLGYTFSRINIYSLSLMIMPDLVPVREKTYKNQDLHPPIDICCPPLACTYLTSYFRIELLLSISFFNLKVKGKLPKPLTLTKMFKKTGGVDFDIYPSIFILTYPSTSKKCL
jgi:hypothetical protein